LMAAPIRKLFLNTFLSVVFFCATAVVQTDNINAARMDITIDFMANIFA